MPHPDRWEIVRKLVVLEVNEIPLALLEWFAQKQPNSTIADLLRTEHVGQTDASEDLGGNELYPSQTWATLAMGVPFVKHGVYWYGDPKPAHYPLYWQLAAEERSVGIVGTLHSSPWDQQADRPTIRFALPDAFADTADAHPSSLGALQSFNLDMTRANTRSVADTRPLAKYAQGLNAARIAGLRLTTGAHLARIAGEVALGRVPKERLRSAQFVLLADVFERQLSEHQPDLSVFFTNHVAAAMHRYWPANFPEDWDEQPYDQAWVERFRHEIPFALNLLDRFIGRVLTFCRRTDRTLVLLSSMGQVGGEEIDAGGDHVLVASEPELFARSLGVSASFEVRSAMAPHVSMRFVDSETASEQRGILEQVQIDGRSLRVDQSTDTVTFTYHLAESGDTIRINGEAHAAADLGLRWAEVAEHKAGHHDPLGTLIVANSPGAQVPKTPVSTLDVAPALLQALDVTPPAHHAVPAVRLS